MTCDPLKPGRVPLSLEILGVTQEQYEQGNLNVHDLIEKAKDPDLFDEEAFDLDMIDENAFDMNMQFSIDEDAFDPPLSPEEVDELHQHQQMLLNAKAQWLEEVKRSMIEDCRRSFQYLLIKDLRREMKTLKKQA